MPATGGAASTAIETGIRGDLHRGMRMAAQLFQKICHVANSTRRQEIYFIGGQAPSVQEWTDERTPRSVFESKITVVNRDFEASLRFHRNDFDDDQANVHGTTIRDLGKRMAQHNDVLVLKDLIDAGEVTTSNFGAAYDGQAFFDTDHVDPDETEFTTVQSNDLTAAAASGTTPSVEEMHQALDDIKEQFRLFKDSAGQPWHDGWDGSMILLVAPDQEQTALRAARAAQLPVAAGSGGTAIDNVERQGMIDVLVNLHTSNTDRMVAIISGPNAWPFLFQQREAIRISSITGREQNSFQTWTSKYDFHGADKRVEVAYAQWRHAILFTWT